MRSGAITVRPSGFCQPDAILARNLFGATPADAVRPVVVLDRLLDAPGDGHAERFAPGVRRDVEIRLVERQRLDQRRDARDRWRTPARETARYFWKSGRTMMSDGHSRTARDIGNRRAHAKRARLVAGRRDHAALGRIAADDDRLAAQRRVVALLDGRIERVHVDVQDAAHGFVAVSYQLPVTSSKLTGRAGLELVNL